MVPIGRGLRQGCPLSPLLFMLFLSEMKAGLEGCGHGFDVSYMLDGQMVSQTLPGLLYADDIVLTASWRLGLQELLDKCARHGDRLGLRFSAQKCAVLRWGSLGGRTESEPVTLQGKNIPFVSAHRYLGVKLSRLFGRV
uniref:Putative tick transposon n=1 Tax=Ixodes ricinus TaxID=34613 RepID=A0A6B0USP0_IXORI